MNGSADALADPETILSPVDACTSKVNVFPASPDLARVLRVPENELPTVPHDPSLHTAKEMSPAAPVWTCSVADPMACDGSVPVVARVVAMRIGTMSPGLPPSTANE